MLNGGRKMVDEGWTEDGGSRRAMGMEDRGRRVRRTEIFVSLDSSKYD